MSTPSRLFLLALVLALPPVVPSLGGCSRQQLEGPAAPVVVAAVAPSTPQAAASASLDAAPPGPPPIGDSRRIRLRKERLPGPDGLPLPHDVDFTPGRPPSAAHPDGTVLVVMHGDDDAYHVTEWDLATRTALHDTTVEPGGAELEIFLHAPSVSVMANMYNDELHLLQLTDSLQLVASHRHGTVSVTGPNALAGDGELTAVLAHGTPDDKGGNRDPSGLFAMTFDAAGNRLAKRILELRVPDGFEPSARMTGNLAVIGGHVYVALMDDKQELLRVDKLTRDLRTEREMPIPLPASFSNIWSQLQDVDGRLVLDNPDQPDLLELSLDLSKVTHRPRPATVPPFPGTGCGTAVRTGSQLLALCDCGRSTCLAWTPPVASP